MAGDGQLVSKLTVRNEMDSTRRTFHGLLDSMSEADLHRPTRGTKWNNEELLFHMLFGYLIVLALIPIVKLFGHLPRKSSRYFARFLNSMTRPFDTVNYLGSRLGAKVYDHSRMGAKFDKTIASLQLRLSRENEAALVRGMPFPARWDPFFEDYMTLADLYHYPTQHFTFHSRQLNLAPDQEG